MHLRKYRPCMEKSHMQTVNWSQHTVGKNTSWTFTDTVQSSVWEHNFSKIWSADIIGGEKLHFPVPHLLTVLCIYKEDVPERSCTLNYISSLLKIAVRKIQIDLKKKYHFTQSVQKFPLNPWSITNCQLKTQKTN